MQRQGKFYSFLMNFDVPQFLHICMHMKIHYEFTITRHANMNKTGSVVMVSNIGWRCQHTVYNVEFWRMAENIFDFQCVYVNSWCSIFCTEIDQKYTVYNFMHNLIENCHVRVEKYFFPKKSDFGSMMTMVSTTAITMMMMMMMVLLLLFTG